MRLRQGRLQAGLALCRAAANLRPASAKYALNLGIALRQSGDLTESERQMNRAIDLDPALEEAYVALAMLYDQEGRNRQKLETIDRYLKWNPQNIGVRLQRMTSGEASVVPR